MKVVVTALFLFFGVETLGRKVSLFISAMGMGTAFYIIGAILKIHPPTPPNVHFAAPSPSPASKAMAAMLYIYVCFYSMGWGNHHLIIIKMVVYQLIILAMQDLFLGSTSPIFSLRERDIMASHLQAHLNGFGVRFNIWFVWFTFTNDIKSTDFVVSKVTPNLYTSLGYKMFLMFGTINIGGAAVFSL